MLWEEEYEAACLAFVAAGDVKVEDGGDAAGNLAEEGCSWGVVGLGLVNGDDEVRELVGAVEVGRACLLVRRWRRRRRRWWWASRVAVISLESNLVAIDSLSAIQIDVVLATLSRLALPKLCLSIKRDRAVASNLESIVWILVLVALQHMGGCCFTFVSMQIHDSESYPRHICVTRAGVSYMHKHYACLSNTKQAKQDIYK